MLDNRVNLMQDILSNVFSTLLSSSLVLYPFCPSLENHLFFSPNFPPDLSLALFEPDLIYLFFDAVL